MQSPRITYRAGTSIAGNSVRCAGDSIASFTCGDVTGRNRAFNVHDVPEKKTQ